MQPGGWRRGHTQQLLGLTMSTYFASNTWTRAIGVAGSIGNPKVLRSPYWPFMPNPFKKVLRLRYQAGCGVVSAMLGSGAPESRTRSRGGCTFREVCSRSRRAAHYLIFNRMASQIVLLAEQSPRASTLRPN